jgi:hypothetical protein
VGCGCLKDKGFAIFQPPFVQPKLEHIARLEQSSSHSEHLVSGVWSRLYFLHGLVVVTTSSV